MSSSPDVESPEQRAAAHAEALSAYEEKTAILPPHGEFSCYLDSGLKLHRHDPASDSPNPVWGIQINELVVTEGNTVRDRNYFFTDTGEMMRIHSEGQVLPANVEQASKVARLIKEGRPTDPDGMVKGLKHRGETEGPEPFFM